MTLDPRKATEIQERLKVQLVSTIGPYGTIRGLSLQQTKRQFVKDWNESLEDYVRDLCYSDVLQMLDDMKDCVRLEHDSESNEFRVRAVNNEKLSHCFWLIDRTKNRKTSDMTCYNCGNVGHGSRECSKPRQRCPDCGGIAHFTMRCLPPRRTIASEEGGNQCYNCKKSGHLTRDCPSKQQDHSDISDARNSKSDIEFEGDPNIGWLEPEYKENIETTTSDVKITIADPNKYSNSAGYPPIYLRLNEPDDWTGIVERSADERELRRILDQK